MSKNPFSEIIEETKTWLNDEYFDQPMVFCEPLDIKKEVKPKKEVLQQPLVRKAKLSDLYPPSYFTDVHVFTCILTTNKGERALIEKMTTAIDERIAKAKVLDVEEVEKNDLWKEVFNLSKSLKHLLISEIEFYKLPNLLKNYQKMPVRSVFDVPLFFLADLKSYNLDIELKKSLWQTLLREL